MYLPHIWKYISVEIDPYASSKPHILWFQWRNDHREVMILILFRNLLIFNGIMNIGVFILKFRIPSYGWIEFDLRKSPRSMPNKETNLVIKWKSNIVKVWTLHLHDIFPISTNRDLYFWLRHTVRCKDNWPYQLANNWEIISLLLRKLAVVESKSWKKSMQNLFLH